MIQVKNLNKSFTVHKKEPGIKGSLKSLFQRNAFKKHALKNINLTLHEGEIIGLIGSNGAGKTTLTKVLSGIIYPSSGGVEVLGYNPWKKDNSFRKKISVIMGQKAQLWWDLPALDSFLLLKEIYQIPDAEYHETISYMSRYLGIESELKVQVRKLSLGERMKVELMAALLHKPSVVLLDEPTIGLDLSAQKAIRSFIKEYRQKYNPIMILTSHYMEDIEELCERVVIMKEGEIVYDGPLNNIKEKHSSLKDVEIKVEKINLSELKSKFSDISALSFTDGVLSFKAKSDLISNIMSFILSHSKVSDISVSNEGISSIIESILSGKSND